LGGRGRRGVGASRHPLRRLSPDHGLVGHYPNVTNGALNLTPYTRSSHKNLNLAVDAAFGVLYIQHTRRRTTRCSHY